MAAVLIPLITHPQGLTVLFTQRTPHLRSHSGQVSFPGGRAEPGDASAEFTALRETEEEIGLSPSVVEVLARLPDYRTRTGYRVTPVVGLLTPPVAFRPDPNEVAEIFETPFGFLMEPANYEQHERQTPDGVMRRFYAMTHDEQYIWGATAGILRALHESQVDVDKRLCFLADAAATDPHR